jgi:hypothetical protein
VRAVKGYDQGMKRRLGTRCCAIVTLVSGCAGGPDPGESEGASASTGAETSGATSGSESTSSGSGSESDSESASTGEPPPPPAPEVIPVMEGVVFYDGYAATVDEPLPAGVIRHNNALVATRLSEATLAKVQTTLTLGVIIGALCDNYDRIGSVNLALAPKGAPTYVPAEVQRIEVARFITPFMDMNRWPMTVPYEWAASDLVPILKDPALLAEFDLWFELSVFGVPYAANKEVAGCAGRSDTQLGSLFLYTDSKAEAPVFRALVPLAISEDFNNYGEGASDAPGLTRKTISFTLPADSPNAQIVLITSNHGANDGGEEYVRREHFVYVDEALALSYTPGRTSCEPFRKYNTQGNGIYGPKPRTDEEWQSFSNWCPGDVIDTRVIPWGAVAAGSHSLVIDVPDAVFVGGQGNFPLSAYVQAE